MHYACSSMITRSTVHLHAWSLFTAVVTGATSALGSAFANEVSIELTATTTNHFFLQIARNGLNVVLVSHNEHSMRALREQIRQ